MTVSGELSNYHKKVSRAFDTRWLYYMGKKSCHTPPGREAILTELHSGHPRGNSGMKAVTRGLVWWPGIDQDIETRVRHCSQCEFNRESPTKAPLQPWTWPTKPWSRLHWILLVL